MSKILGIITLLFSLILLITGGFFTYFDFIDNLYPSPELLSLHYSLISLFALIGISAFGILLRQRWGFLLYSAAVLIGLPVLFLVSRNLDLPIHSLFEVFAFLFLMILFIFLFHSRRSIIN